VRKQKFKIHYTVKKYCQQGLTYNSETLTLLIKRIFKLKLNLLWQFNKSLSLAQTILYNMKQLHY